MDSGLIFLLLSVLSSTIIVLIFKAFSHFKIDSLQAIVVNYAVCVVTGSVVLGEFPIKMGFWNEVWFPYALGLGLLFIGGFNLLAQCVDKYGVAITSVAQKMSLVLSVSFAILFFGEGNNWLKMLGISLALIAVVLTNIPPKANSNIASDRPPNSFLYLVILTFLISGIIEVALQYVEKEVASQADDPSFTIFLFLTAGVFGAIYWLINVLFRNKHKPAMKNVVGGIVLGIPNYFSIFFLMLTLGQPNWEGSVVYPVNNVGVIGLSTLLAFVVFKERLSKVNILGVLLAIVAIILIGFSLDLG